MSEANEPTTGIPNSDKPGWWIVPPWPVHASLCDVVSHFLCFLPRDNASATEKLAYYKGYLTAMEAAPRHELTHHHDERWYEDLRDCIGRCVTMHQDKRTAEIQRSRRVHGSGPHLAPALQTPHPVIDSIVAERVHKHP
jgi:hypothetical protein